MTLSFKKTALTAATIAIFPQSAAARICMAPTVPYAFLSKPSKPLCAMRQTCSDWEVRNYNDDIDHYFKKLKAYLEAVEQYQADAYEYAKCMAELD